ncbi:DUF4762 family protein [Serratia sp. JUb9]|uniref:DUF4762 family protein n=1 Tax=unclassified Serratia (in: enterobacteria) TaxID=2647522 RepID=UPI000DA3C070|nr:MULTISPECIES: DUF4762 family protein [unclassified Serratia (in: enterobacteria)]MBU3891827.1 DUF4762 family protein [Serratia rubidaea]MCA4823771.1 DUF4762 family protein [Serratia rubidaea]QNK33689.1 DUF4762 family protein [Serratia sp. JUb9]QPT12366.1 DUF4762 family protein [Serratia rubidaea]CAE1148799.1 conserved protein of unknown function [Serratia sp. Tan611]
MQKLAQGEAMNIIGGAWGCKVSHSLSPSSSGLACYRTVGCVDKFGNVTSSSKPVELNECAAAIPTP